MTLLWLKPQIAGMTSCLWVDWNYGTQGKVPPLPSPCPTLLILMILLITYYNCCLCSCWYSYNHCYRLPHLLLITNPKQSQTQALAPRVVSMLELTRVNVSSFFLLPLTWKQLRVSGSVHFLPKWSSHTRAFTHTVHKVPNGPFHFPWSQDSRRKSARVLNLSPSCCFKTPHTLAACQRIQSFLYRYLLDYIWLCFGFLKLNSVKE